MQSWQIVLTSRRVRVLGWLVLLSWLVCASQSGSQALQSNALANVSAASFRADSIAPETIVSAFGAGVATQNATGTDTDPNTAGVQLPTTLAGTSVRVNGQLAGLFFVSANQVNYVVPINTAPGPATVQLTSGNGQTFTGPVEVKQVAPAVFSANANGEGVPAAVALRVKANGQQVFEPVATLNQATNRFQTSPLDLGPEGERVFLVLFLSGVRNAPDPNGDRNVNEFVRVLINGLEVVPAFAGKQGGLVGMDQINVELPRGLLGSAGLDVTVLVNGFGVSNVTRVELSAPPITNLNWRPLGLANRIIRSFATVGPYLFAASNQGVARSSDNGVNWVNVNDGLPTGASIQTLLANGTTLYAGLPGGGVYCSANNGVSWTAINAGLSGATLTINNLLFFGPTLYAATQGGVCAYNNGQWQALNTGLATLDSATLLVYGGRLCVGTRGGGIFLLNGTQWGGLSNGLPTGAQVLSFANAGAAVYAGLQGGGLCVSRNSGQLWTQVAGGLPANLTIYSIWVDGARVYVATASGIYVSNDSGLTWTLLNTGLTNPKIYAVYAIAARLLAGSDGSGVFGSALATSSGNRVPVAYTQAVATNEDTALPIILSGLDLDLDPVNYFIQNNPANGSLSGLAPNVLYTPRSNFNGTDRFTFVVTDGRGGTSPAAEVSILVNPVNDPPVVSVPAPITVNAGTAVNFTIGVTDPDGDVVTVTTSTLPSGANFNASTRAFSWTPTTAGVFPLTFTGSDGKTSTSATVTITVNAAVIAWQQLGTGLNGINKVWDLRADGTTIYAAGDGGIWRSVNSGVNWTAFSTGLDTSRLVYRLAFISGKLYAATTGGLFVLNNEASGWTKITNGLPVTQMLSVAGAGATIFVGTQSAGVYRSTDGGASFTSFASQQFNATASAVSLYVDGDYVLAGGYGTSNQGLYRSLVGTANWSYINSFGVDFPVSYQRVNNTLYAGGSGYLYTSADLGATWQRSVAQAQSTGQFYGFVVTPEGIYAAGTGGVVVFTNNNGTTWTRITDGITSNQTIGLIRDGNRVLVGGVNAVFSRPLTSPNLNSPPTLAVPGTFNLNVGTALSFQVAATDPDAGQTLTYTASSLPSGANFNNSPRTFTWTPAAAGSFTVNFTVTDSGTPPLSDTRAVVINVTTGGGGGGGSLSFTKASVGSGLVRSMLVHNNTVWAGLLPGGMFRSTDNGATFTAANNGLGNQQTLALAGRGNAVLCGTNSGVYRTTDNGANWALSSTGLPASAIVFALYASGDTVFAGVAGQGVYRSTNDGASWTPSNSGMAGVSVLALAQFGATLYAGANSQGVYISTNGGSNWTQVNNGIPSNARNLTAFAGAGSTVYAATFVQSGLYGTTDNGSNWAQAATGLPTTTNSVLNGIAAVGNNLFVNPLQGSLYRATHPSLTWTAVTGTNAPTNVYTLIASGNYLYAGDQTGNVYVTPVQ